MSKNADKHFFSVIFFAMGKIQFFLLKEKLIILIIFKNLDFFIFFCK